MKKKKYIFKYLTINISLLNDQSKKSVYIVIIFL